MKKSFETSQFQNVRFRNVSEPKKLLTTLKFPPFKEESNGKPRNYCNIICPGADTAYLIKRIPQNHRSCFGHFTYKIEQRSPNFFIWRDAKCRSSSVEFLIRCEFLSARSSFRSDEDIFEEANRIATDLRQ
uniref:DUF7808 domain-containing protein n=1 Tax=Caenorhabditis japonica TaxID=281687 RepID=A0A8R1HKE6_CAEJA